VTLPVGTNRLTLEVTDDQGLTGKATIRIRVKRSTSLSEPTDTAQQEVILPPPPYNLEAVQKYQEVALTWLVEPGINPPYRIYRIVDDGLDEPYDVRDWLLLWEEPEKLSYRDETGEVGIPYLYTVRTFDGVNESVNSNVVAITLMEQNQPEETEPPSEPPVPTATAVPTQPPVPTATDVPEPTSTPLPTEDPAPAEDQSSTDDATSDASESQ
jgi:hypothetical protein